MITVSCVVRAPITRVWDCFNKAEHIVNWAFASADWHAPKARADVRVGGTFLTTMAAKDGSTAFDFEGTYTQVVEKSLIEYEIADGRKVRVVFIPEDTGVKIEESFELEGTHSAEQQRAGWQAILDTFKSYAESISK